MKKIFFFALLPFLFIIGCNSGNNKNTYSEIFKKHKPRIDEIRNFLTGLKNSIPEAGTRAVVIGKLNPILDMTDKEELNNTIVLQYDFLDQPETFYSADSLYGLFNNRIVAEAFQWSGINQERKIFEMDYLKDAEVDKILNVLSTERFPYLLVTRTIRSEPFQIKQAGEFSGGNTTAAFYVYDLRSKKLLSSNTFSASPAADLMIAYNQRSGASGQRDAAKSKAKETMKKNMRDKVFGWLKEITGNTVVMIGY